MQYFFIKCSIPTFKTENNEIEKKQGIACSKFILRKKSVLNGKKCTKVFARILFFCYSLIINSSSNNNNNIISIISLWTIVYFCMRQKLNNCTDVWITNKIVGCTSWCVPWNCKLNGFLSSKKLYVFMFFDSICCEHIFTQIYDSCKMFVFMKVFWISYQSLPII